MASFLTPPPFTFGATSQGLNSTATSVKESLQSIKDKVNTFNSNYVDSLNKPMKDVQTLGLGWFLELVNAEDGQGQGSLAQIFKPKKGNETVNIVNDFVWTATPIKNRADIPYIELKEHIVEGGNVQKQFELYTSGFSTAAADLLNPVGNPSRPTLDVYEEIFIRNESGWRYKFPYFSKIQYELATAAWEKFDKIGESVSGFTSGISQSIKGFLPGTAGVVEGLGKAVGAGAEMAATIGKFNYPIVDIADRPRLFTSHNERSITIQFPLFNTLNPFDWQKNREFLTLFQSQNLFNKRNFATGLPPVWYEVYVPNQYYSVASCVTNIRVENLGNIRKEVYNNMDMIVPDAYQVEITLQEMAMPSKNQFHSALGGVHPFGRVNASIQQEAPEAPGTISPSTVIGGLSPILPISPTAFQ